MPFYITVKTFNIYLEVITDIFNILQNRFFALIPTANTLINVMDIYSISFKCHQNYRKHQIKLYIIKLGRKIIVFRDGEKYLGTFKILNWATDSPASYPMHTQTKIKYGLLGFLSVGLRSSQSLGFNAISIMVWWD